MEIKNLNPMRASGGDDPAVGTTRSLCPLI